MYHKPKKSLGQNFLTDKNIQKKIINACGFKATDTVLEIGAGRGELTSYIARKVNEVYALEIDVSLCGILKDGLKYYKNVKILNQDILKFNLRKYFNRYKPKIKVVGNIPYYITSPIIEYLLRYCDMINTIFITLQKEFAKRITAQAGSREYGSFSCFVQYYTQPQILFLVKKNCFYPPPNVDSCFLKLDIRKEPLVDLKNEQLFFKIIRAAFGKRRKTLRNSLKDVITAKKLERFFIQYNIDFSIRPEALTLRDFANLTKMQD